LTSNKFITIVNPMITQNINTWVGPKVDSVIADAGMTKAAISEKTGIPYSTLNSKIHGRSPFSLDDLLRIAEATHHSPMDLLPVQFHASQELTA
jgi:predicted transcriptional regulator